MTVFRVFVAVLLVTLTGCIDRTVDAYLYGAASSCFPGKNSATCDRLKIYDTVALKILIEMQEVTYVQKGLWLDESNTLFGKLSNCKVVDRENFACEGLVRIEGQFTDTSVFKTTFLSTAYFPSASARYLSTSLKRTTLEFWERNGWLEKLIIVFALLTLIGVFSRS